MNMQGAYHELLYFRNEIVLASRLANIEAPVDGVTVDFKDVALIQLETEQAKNLGFAGKLCIHPNQVEIVNQVFSPRTVEIEWATRVLQTVEAAQGQAVSLDGKMIDLPVILKAKRILEQATFSA
jgi:citrate lyase subunit beta/citryl-CoA lyase